MFGMDDPSKVVTQYRRYAAEGRLELAEVMAAELSVRAEATPAKERTLDQQRLLCDVLRDLASIHELREKWDQSVAAGKRRDGARRQLVSMLRERGDAAGADAEVAKLADDLVQTGRALVGHGKLGPALRSYAQASKAHPGHLEAAMRPLAAHQALKGGTGKAGKQAAALAQAMGRAGPLLCEGELYALHPEGQNPIPLDVLEAEIDQWMGSGLSGTGAEALKTQLAELRSQRARIAVGEQAANATLAAAVDSLKPVHDYHAYSSGKTSGAR